MFKAAFNAPRFRPAINVGCLFDHATGSYELGKHGDSILNGGVGSITGIAARPNSYKTHLMVYMMSMVRLAMRQAHNIVYDTDGTLYPYNRFETLGARFVYLRDIDWREDTYFAFTDISQYTGDAFFTLLRKTVEAKHKEDKKWLADTPFVDAQGNYLQAMYPSLAGIDTLSRMSVAAVEETYEKNDIGTSGMNTEAMNNGRAKKQMFNQLPTMCARTGTYLFLTAHIKNEINMEMFPTDKRALTFLKKDTTLEGVSGGFYSLPNNLFMVTHNKTMIDSKKKTPVYPWDNAEAVEGDTDLAEITLINIRGKNGVSGMPLKIIVSQSLGVLDSLTEFHHCKDNNYFGIEGNLQNYAMALLPDVKLSRTTIRKKLEEHPKLKAAVKFTSGILQIYEHHRLKYSDLLCEPKTLYEDLIKIGYDWDVLLNTVHYWAFNDEETKSEAPRLTTMDLLRMRKGLYVPFWFTKEQRKALKPEHFVKD